MEHRLILGGEPFLPFARSQVAKLKKLGLPYVNQSFEVDGVSIKVRIEPGHEYIRIEGGSSAYLETGQLEPSEIVPDHPNRGKPAKWHFLDITTDSPYLGLCDVVGKPPTKPEGVQLNDPALTEGMDSLAIGYKHDPDPVKDAAAREGATEAIVAKTIASGLFPPSRWSGLMRLFMQSLYGAKQEKFPFTLVEVGTEIALRYVMPKSADDLSLQFGLWSHSSPGIFSAEEAGKPLGKFWLINIKEPTGAYYSVTAYRIKFGASANVVRSQYLKKARLGTLTPEVRVKLEAYMFADCTIDLANPQEVGSFVGARGSALAYGWKFNKTGSKASIVVHQTLGTGDHDLRWNANTIHATITLGVDPNTELDRLSVSAEVIPAGEWTDGWGVYNIFVPMFDATASDGFGLDALVHASLARDRLSVAPPMAFSDVPVYGYYKDNVWTPTLMTRTIEAGPWPKYEQESDTPYPDPFAADTVHNRYQFDAHLVDADWSYTSLERTEGGTMDLTVGDRVFLGTSKFGAGVRIEHKVVSLGSWGGPASWINYLSETVSDGNLFFAPESIYGSPPGWDAYGNSGIRWEQGAAHFLSRIGSTATDTWVTYGYKFDSWTLVIPAYDCEAVFVGTLSYELPETIVREHHETNAAVTGIAHDGARLDGGSSGRMEVIPYTGYTFSFGSLVTTDALPPASEVPKIYCFTPFIPGTQGTFHAGTTPLFVVDYHYPYYAAGMGVYTSYGGRYSITEGLVSPASVVYGQHFVGWA